MCGGTPTSYVIEAGSSPGLADLANFSIRSTATAFSASGIASGAYYVRVRASNAVGVGPSSNEAVLTIVGACSAPPGPPGGLRVVSVNSGAVVLAWNVSSGIPTTYVVEAGSGPGLADLANADLGGTATTLTATGVVPGTYYVRVRARNTCGASAASNEITVSMPT
jgi:predicted phage tail protein